jgi:tetratricopeptide (TPR) repeat protein
MNKQIVKDVTALRLEANIARRDAQQEADPAKRTEHLAKAMAALNRAIGMLNRELRVAEKQSLSAADRGALREMLSSTIGSLGGTYRDAKDYDKALEQYNKGNAVEDARRKEDGALDSYNLVQRQVVRLLKDPALVTDDGFRADLADVDRELERQSSLGRSDSWFIADRILTRFLRDGSADEILSTLESKEATKSFYESTDKLVGDLLNEGLGKGGPLEEKLRGFRQLLQRRGGLKAAT